VLGKLPTLSLQLQKKDEKIYNVSYDTYFMHANPTTLSYTSLTRAYDYFNTELFSGGLPPCLLTMQRHTGSFGYFSKSRFANAADPGEITDEIALNPVHFNHRLPLEVLSTLVHEMAHLWRSRQGNPPRQGYHDRVWADKMLTLGLIPSATGKSGGAQTGQHVTHCIQRGGLYEKKQRRFSKRPRQFSTQTGQRNLRSWAKNERRKPQARRNTPVPHVN
jgi:hypothetical protein